MMPLLKGFWILGGLSLTELKRYSLLTLLIQACRVILTSSLKVLHATASCQNSLMRIPGASGGVLGVKASGLIYGCRVVNKSGQS